MSKPWSHKLEWLNDGEFKTRRFSFVGSVSQYERETFADKIKILKDRQFIDIYRDIIPNGADRIFEIGFFQGGMPLFLADMIEPTKLVGVDFYPPTADLIALIAQSGLEDTIKLYGDVLQNDVPKITNILKAEFGSDPLDLIIDDCSHEYENTKICFENCFGYLKPGGRYIIEDWGWLHWPGEPWQSSKSHFHGKPGMTNIIFEAVMTHATNPNLISRIEILSHFCAVFTRGTALAHGEPFKFENSYLTAGRKFVPM